MHLHRANEAHVNDSNTTVAMIGIYLHAHINLLIRDVCKQPPDHDRGVATVSDTGDFEYLRCHSAR